VPIFGRKKKELEEVKEAVEAPVEKPEEVKPPVEKPPEKPKPALAPLFVKLERYRAILDTITWLKSTLAMVREGFATLNELERLRSESMSVLQETLAKIEEYLLTLDAEFARPTGYVPTAPVEVKEVGKLESTLADLRYQVDRLKAELERLK
jgi:hypothetical protein